MIGFPERDVLLDTGPIVAVVHQRDQWHRAVADRWPSLARRCVTTEAVLTEATHLLAARGAPPALALRLLLAADIPILAAHLPLHEQCEGLMERYADVPMDYADATLVAVADRLHVNRIFTQDRRGFGIFRGARGRALDIV